MINLIPPHARKQVQLEYWIRVVSVWAVLIALVCAIIGILLLPSYLLVQAQLSEQALLYTNASAKNDSYTALENDVRTANEAAAKLLDTDTEPLFSMYLNMLDTMAQGLVSLENVTFAREQGNVDSIQITGVAGSRTLLSQFQNTIEAHPLILSAKVPLSNLAKDKDIPFNINVIINHDNAQ